MGMEILNVAAPGFRPYGKAMVGYPLMPLLKAMEQPNLSRGHGLCVLGFGAEASRRTYLGLRGKNPDLFDVMQ